VIFKIDRLLLRTEFWIRTQIENYRQIHVAQRCVPGFCDCPCGYCHHDRRHTPGEP
jgi:hypothetical protein